MQTFQIKSQANQRPFPGRRRQTAQGELAKAQDFLDDANDGFNGRFTQTVNGLADFGTQLVSHLFLEGSVGWRFDGLGKEGPPAPVVGVTTSGNVRVNAAIGQPLDIVLTKIACVQAAAEG